MLSILIGQASVFVSLEVATMMHDDDSQVGFRHGTLSPRVDDSRSHAWLTWAVGGVLQVFSNSPISRAGPL